MSINLTNGHRAEAERRLETAEEHPVLPEPAASPPAAGLLTAPSTASAAPDDFRIIAQSAPPAPPAASVTPPAPAPDTAAGQASAAPTGAAPTSAAPAEASRRARLKGVTEKWFVPLGTVLGVLVSLNTWINQIPALSGTLGQFPPLRDLADFFSGVTVQLYIGRAVILPALLLLGVAAFIWAVRGRRAKGALWRFAATGAVLLLALVTFMIRPAERVIGVLPYQPTAESQVDPALGQELADYLRGALTRSGGFIKAVGVSRIAGESLTDASKRIGAQVVVDGSYTLGKGSLETRVTLFDANTGSMFGTPDVRATLREDIPASQEDVARLVGDQVDVASAVTHRAVAAAGPGCASAYECYVLGRRYYLWFSEEGYNRAIDDYHYALQFDPQYARAYAGLAEAHLLLAGLYNSEGKSKEANALWDQADDEAQQAVAYGPGLVESHRARAWLYNTRGQREAARAEFDQIAKLSPLQPGTTLTATLTIPSIHPSSDAESLWLLGTYTQDLDNQIALFREALRLNPDLPQVHHDLAVALYARGDLDGAEKELLLGLANNPNMVYCHVSLAQLYLTRFVLARQAESPAIVVTTSTLTLATSADPYLVEARQHIDLALTQMPDLAPAAYLKGTILAAQGSLQPAIATARQALIANPNAAVWFGMTTYDDPLTYRQWISVTQQLITTLPDYVYSYNTEGNLYVAAGRTYEALRVYSQAVTLDPSFGVAWYNLSAVQSSLGQVDEAVISARRAVSETTAWNIAYTQLGRALLLQAENRRPELVASAQMMAPATPTPTGAPALTLPTPLTTPPVPAGCATSPPPAAGDVTALYAAAETTLRKALDLEPHDAFARYTLGQVLLDQAMRATSVGQADGARGKVDEARQQLEQVTAQVNEFSPQAHALLGGIYWSQNRLDDAARELEQAFTIDPGDSTIYGAYQAFLRSRDSAAAAQLADRQLQLAGQLLADHPRSPTYHARQAMLYQADGQADKALQEYTTALQIDPTSPDLHSFLGMFYFFQQKYDLALPEFERAAQLAPNVHYFRGYMGTTLKFWADAEAAKGATADAATHYQQAQDNYRAAMEINPTADYHTWIGDIYLAQKKYTEAEQEYRQATTGQDLAFERLGLAYQSGQQYDRALAAYKQANCLAPGNSRYYMDLASVYQAQQQYAAAVKELQAAIALAPADALLHNALAQVYFINLKQPAQAIAEYQIAVQLAPDTALYHANLANAYYQTGKYEQAAAEFEAAGKTAVTDDSQRGQYAYYLGRCDAQLQRWDAARVALEQAATLAPNRPDVLADLALAYKHLGDPRSCPTMSKAATLAAQSSDAATKATAADYRAALESWHCP